jgi:hypothetical protein
MGHQAILLIVLGIAIWLPTTALIGVYLFRKLQMKERIAAIERGADLTFDPEETASRTRRSGIVFIAAGLGISAADVIVVVAAGDPTALVFQAVAIIPIAIGIGLLVDYRISRRERDAKRGSAR